MKKNLNSSIGLFCCIFLLLAVSSAYAKPAMDITYPKNDDVLGGYFVPVSWTDPAVEKSRLAYPDNYSSSGKNYHIVISDPDGNVLLEQTVNNQNYCVFTYEEIMDILEQKIYLLTVNDLKTGTASEAVRFFYQRPFCEVPDDVLMGTTAEELSLSPEMQTESSASATTMALTSDCAYCRTYMWPGVLVILVNATNYNKYITMTCNQTTWYSNTVQAGFSGPVFVNISSGNFRTSYYDGIVSTYKCTTITPFAYTIIQFP